MENIKRRKEIIPAIDIVGGRCVRLTQGDFSRSTLYETSPVDLAKSFEELGIRRLHLVDLEGAESSRSINLKVLEDICRETRLQVDYSGGIRGDNAIQDAFNAGAGWVCIGSMAYRDTVKTRSWFDRYGAGKIILSADIRDDKICIDGWKMETETTIDEFLMAYKGVVKSVICTDISRDGMLQGASTELYKRLTERYSDIDIIASGGVGSAEDIEQLMRLDIFGVIIGKAIYEGRVDLREIIGK